jgi:hypothetical protein
VFKFPDRIVYLCGLSVKEATQNYPACQNFQAVLVKIGQNLPVVTGRFMAMNMAE